MVVYSMSFLGDFGLWKSYSRALEKLDRSNIATPSRANPPKRIPNPALNDRISFVSNRKSFRHTEVSSVARSTRKHFLPTNTIDLHGYTRDIDFALENFCADNILKNRREVIVITGKGRGIVKGATVNWLKNHPEFVIGFFEIRDSRGGSGSFGVRLRAK